MCGIVGAISEQNIERVLLDGLKRLEYRGYDSAGLAVLNRKQQFQRLRTRGKVRELENLLNQSLIQGYSGIAHTRWATHGVPSEQNAHPLSSHDEILLVHNGIIENHEPLRQFLIEEGYQFVSETDSETVVHLIHYYLKLTQDLLQATQKTIAQLEGAFALGIMSIAHPERIIAVRHGCPLVIGKGVNENFFASDPLALLAATKQFSYLEDGDIAVVTKDNIEIHSAEGVIERPFQQLDYTLDAVDRGEYRHFMYKEIFDQPQALLTSLEGRLGKEHILESAFGLSAKAIFQQVENVQIVACGTSLHAGLVARYWLESLSGIPCSVEIASEFRYRKTVVQPNTLFIALSQSGETADTLAALRLSKKMGYLSSLAICNVAESSLIR